MREDLLNLRLKFHNQPEDFIRACQLVIIRAYPDLILRWSRVYGKRWSYLFGGEESQDIVGLNPLRIKLNSDFGVCIENPDRLTQAELDQLTGLLKECFS